MVYHYSLRMKARRLGLIWLPSQEAQRAEDAATMPSPEYSSVETFNKTFITPFFERYSGQAQRRPPSAVTEIAMDFDDEDSDRMTARKSMESV